MKITDELINYNEDAKLALIIRHADRELIPDSEFGNDVLLNEKGIKNSIKFGKLLKQYTINKIITSPIDRCVQTSKLIVKGYRKDIEIIQSKALGDPGLHVYDAKKTGDFYLKHGFDEMYKRYKTGQKIPGVPKPEELKKSMTNFITTNTNQKGITIFITHDSVIAFYDFALNNKSYTKENWINYLSGMILEIQ
ncbi:MAG: histidine phosphatase family protein [Bacteroidales bacterium]|nr:histidine phosphatase family protein [Bacteroidales bacterium]